jgi:uncharacterized cupin superfamily protein
MKIERQSERQFNQLKSSRTGEEFSLSSILSESVEADGFFITQEIIKPHSRASSPHFHTDTDELVFVTRGNLVAYEGEEKTELSEGDICCFKAGSGRLHYIANESESEAQALVIKKKTEKSDVAYS